ncbi:signal recognition [Cystoisospora suis]|uniref:Signal recognition particle subunit SRP68 n=1 Tax=Cystoisospora suis TaxID=483139 RepID=A0A2C6L5J7_9APIC|nr:signal recognition [Cystoisospora suis]
MKEKEEKEKKKKKASHTVTPSSSVIFLRILSNAFQMQAERAWSYGMQLKGENAASAVIDPRVRAHALRRFSKAVSYARLLEELCHSHTPSLLHPSLPDFKSTPSSSSALSHDKEVEKSSSSSPSSSPPAGETSGTSTKLLGNESSSSTSQSSPSSSTGAGHATKMKGKEKSFFLFSREERDGFLSSLGCNLVSLCDEKTCLDAKAYRMSLEALLLQEKEDWREASERLQELQQVYIHLKRVSSTHEKEEKLFKHLLSSIEPQLRLCAFHSGGVASFAASMTTATQAGRKKREEEEEGDSSSLSSSTTRKSLRLSGSGSSAMKKKASPSSGTAGSHEEEEEGEPSSSSFGIWWRGEELRAKRGNEKIRSAVLMAQKTIPQTVLLDDTEMSRLLDEEEKIWGTSKEKIHKKGKKGDEEEEEEVEGNSSLEEKILSMLSQEKSTASVVER